MSRGFDSMVFFHNPLNSVENPRWVYLGKDYTYVFELLTGIPRPKTSIQLGQFKDPSDDPRAHAVHGAWKAGWSGRQFPWGYSLPSDIQNIAGELARMTDEDLLGNLATGYRKRSTTDKNELPEYMRAEYTLEGYTLAEYKESFSGYRGRFLPMLRRFCENARAEGEIVLYNLG